MFHRRKQTWTCPLNVVKINQAGKTLDNIGRNREGVWDQWRNPEQTGSIYLFSYHLWSSNSEPSTWGTKTINQNLWFWCLKFGATMLKSFGQDSTDGVGDLQKNYSVINSLVCYTADGITKVIGMTDGLELCDYGQ